MKKLAVTRLPKLALPDVILPDTVKLVNVPVLVMFGCAAVVTVPAVVALVAAPVKAPTNVVAVIDALPKLALILVLITADELPFADEVVNVGYTVVEVDVFCNNAAAFVALDTVPVTLAPAKEVKLAPDPTNKLAETTFAPVRFPPVPDVTILAAVKLPVAFNVPATLTPVPVTINILALPAALILTLPFAAGILTFEFPFANTPTKLPDVVLPDTVKLVNVPVLVMFGCAAVVTVPAVVALVALDTVPVTLAPTNELNPLPLPVKTPVFAVNAAPVVVPTTFNDVNVPTLVIFGCAAVVITAVI